MSMTRRSLMRSLAGGMVALAGIASRPAQAATIEPLAPGYGLLADDTMLLTSVDGPLPEMTGRVVPGGATVFIGDDGPELIHGIDHLNESVQVLSYAITLDDPWTRLDAQTFPGTARYRQPITGTLHVED